MVAIVEFDPLPKQCTHLVFDLGCLGRAVLTKGLISQRRYAQNRPRFA